MDIRRADLADAKEIATLIGELSERFITGEFEPEAKRGFLQSNDLDAVTRFMESGFSYHVAETEGVTVGVVGVRDNSHLYHLFVGAAHHGKGLARQLWNVAMAECLNKGNPGVFTVNSSNNAVGVYERFGFVRTAPMQTKDGVTYNPMELRV